MGLPWWLSGKEFACQCRRCRFDPWVGKIPWSRKWQPSPVFLPGKSHRQRNLAGYSPRGCKELDVTEHTHRHTQTTSTWMSLQWISATVVPTCLQASILHLFFSHVPCYLGLSLAPHLIPFRHTPYQDCLRIWYFLYVDYRLHE